MFPTLVAWLDAHPVLRGALWMIAIAVAGTFVNWVTYKRSDAEWELYQMAYPHRAMLIRVCRAVFPHLRKIPQLAAFFPPDDPGTPNRFERATPPTPPPAGSKANRWHLIAVALLVSLAGCSWFKPAANTPPPAQAVVLYTAKALAMINAECAQASDNWRARALTDVDPSSRIVTLKKADALAADCEQATVAGRAALEGVEHLIETGVAISDARVGCAVKRGLDAAADVCTAIRVSKLIDRCPAYIDSAITFGSPLLAVVGACPLEGK